MEIHTFGSTSPHRCSVKVKKSNRSTRHIDLELEYAMKKGNLGGTTSTRRLRIVVAAGTFATVGLLGGGIAVAGNQSSHVDSTTTSTTLEVSTPERTVLGDPVGGPNDQSGQNLQDTQSGDQGGPNVQDTQSSDIASTDVVSADENASELSSALDADGANGPQIEVGSTVTGAD
jgi:hypothetical protein